MADQTSVKDYGYYFFKSGFDNDTVTPVIEWIVEENFQTGDKRKPQLTLVINSPGGKLHSAFALIDTMKGSSIIMTGNIQRITDFMLMMRMMIID